MEAKYNFQYSTDKSEVTLFDFYPKNQLTLDQFKTNNSFNRLFYFQSESEKVLDGSIYSYLFYGKNIHINFSKVKNTSFIVEKKIPTDGFETLKQFAISLNKDEIIFPMSYIEKFKKNSLNITENDLSVQIYSDNKLVGHVSIIKNEYPLFEDKNLFLLMRFLIHEDFRQTEVKELLLQEVSSFLPKESSLFLQVFPKNTIAINFFKKRLNVNLAFTKKLIENV